MMFDGQNRLRFRPANDIVFSPWKDPRANLNAELQTIYYNNGGARVLKPSDSLRTIAGNLFIWGHGEYGDFIGNDNRQSTGARKLARLLSDCGLPDTFSGNIIVWTCFGGVPGGLAQSLMIYLKNSGYQAVTVWGSRLITGPMMAKLFYVIPDIQMRATGDTELSPFGTGMQPTAQPNLKKMRVTQCGMTSSGIRRSN